MGRNDVEKSFNQGLWRERGRGEERKMLSHVLNFRFSKLGWGGGGEICS